MKICKNMIEYFQKGGKNMSIPIRWQLPLKVNETDFEWEKIKNHISGIWNSSDIG